MVLDEPTFTCILFVFQSQIPLNIPLPADSPPTKMLYHVSNRSRTPSLRDVEIKDEEQQESTLLFSPSPKPPSLTKDEIDDLALLTDFEALSEQDHTQDHTLNSSESKERASLKEIQNSKSRRESHDSSSSSLELIYENKNKIVNTGPKKPANPASSLPCENQSVTTNKQEEKGSNLMQLDDIDEMLIQDIERDFQI